ncbi:MAG: hypothetical protein KJI71_04935 [Patescibacteria group bacterium]|nr:hypothetical protein [Patescibacteria group bacterium]
MAERKYKKRKEIKIKLNGKSIKVGGNAIDSKPGSSKEELMKQMKKAVSKRVFEVENSPVEENG